MKKRLAFFFSIIFVLITLVGCNDKNKQDSFYQTLNSLIQLEGNANTIEVKLVTEDKEALGDYKEYAYLLLNEDQKYVLNLKADAIRSEDNKMAFANIYYKIADMKEYELLTDVYLSESILYVNADLLTKAVGKIFPEYKLMVTTFFKMDAEYIQFDLSKYLDDYMENRIDYKQIANAAGTQLVKFLEDAFKDINPAVVSQKDDEYRLEVNKENVEKINSGIIKTLKSTDGYYDNFLKDIDESKVDAAMIEEFKNNKDEFLTRCITLSEDLEDNSEQIKKFKDNNTVMLFQTKVDGENGSLNISKKDDTGNSFSVNYKVSNKEKEIEIPDDVEEMDPSLWEFLMSIF